MHKFNATLFQIPEDFFIQNDYLNNKYVRTLKYFGPFERKEKEREKEKSAVKDTGMYYTAIMIKTMWYENM